MTPTGMYPTRRQKELRWTSSEKSRVEIDVEANMLKDNRWNHENNSNNTRSPRGSTQWDEEKPAEAHTGVVSNGKSPCDEGQNGACQGSRNTQERFRIYSGDGKKRVTCARDHREARVSGRGGLLDWVGGQCGGTENNVARNWREKGRKGSPVYRPPDKAWGRRGEKPRTVTWETAQQRGWTNIIMSTMHINYMKSFKYVWQKHMKTWV